MNPFASEYDNHTTLHPGGALAVLVLGIMLVVLNRRNAALPLLLVACFIPSSQRIVLVGLDFNFMRIMVLFGAVRVLLRGEVRGFRWVGLDTLLIVWAATGAVFPILRSGDGSMIVNRLGATFDIVGMYFMFRVLIQSWEDVRMSVRWIIVLSLPVAMFFVLERLTGRNIFSVFGYVPEITKVREGRLRCQGAFSHPILAGAFWAAAMPLIVSEWRQPGANKLLVSAACISSLLIVVLSASSTPVLGLLAGAIGGAMYRVRNHLRLVRWGLLLTVVFLHLVMKAPVWHLIARVSAVGGGSSWHRFSLVDGFLTHWYEWWLVGSYVGSGHWGHYTFDVTNYYIVQGLHGGLLQLGVWTWLISLAFSYIGRLRIASESSTLAELVFVWGIGVSLMVHCVNLFGVSYFGQIWLSWYMLLGIIGSLYAANIKRANFPNSIVESTDELLYQQGGRL